MSAKYRFELVAAQRAMQAGVALEMSIGEAENCEPKHLRVGVNNALCDVAAIARLMIEKGLFTEEEYVDALTAEANREVERYEQSLSQELGKKVRLAPGVATIDGQAVGN